MILPDVDGDIFHQEKIAVIRADKKWSGFFITNSFGSRKMDNSFSLFLLNHFCL